MQPIIATLILDGGGARHRPAHHQRPDHHHLLHARTASSATASCSACRSPRCSRSVVVVVLHALLTATRSGLFIRADRHQPRGARAWPACARRITARALCVSAASCAGRRRPHHQLQRQERGRQQRRHAARSSTPSSPSTLGGTALTGGRFSLAGTAIGALIIQTLTTDYLFARRAARGEPGVQGGAGLRGDAAAVGRVPRERCATATPSPWHDRRWAPSPLPASTVASCRCLRRLLLFVRHGGGSAPRRTTASCRRRCSSTSSIDNAFLLIAAVGMTFVILTGGIDLSVGLGAGADRPWSRRALIEHARGSPWLVVAAVARRAAPRSAPCRASSSTATGCSRSSSRWPACSSRARPLLPHRHRVDPGPRSRVRGLADDARFRSGGTFAVERRRRSRSSPWRRRAVDARTPRASAARCTRSAAARSRRRSWACRWARTLVRRVRDRAASAPRWPASR